MVACVTGYGIIDALGSTDEECYANYMSQANFVSTITTKTNINKAFMVDDSSIALPNKINPINLSKNSRMALHVVEQALTMAGVHGSNVGVFFSSNVPLDHLTDYMSNHLGLSTKRAGPRKIIDGLTGSVPSLICLTYGFEGINVGVNAACATGLATIDYAMRYIDDYDFIVVGTSDSVSSVTVSSFNTLGALANESMPFDQNRAGFVLGEGAGCIVIESEERAKARRAPILARLHRMGVATDAFSETMPDKDGRGEITAMKKALSYANKRVDFVNAHGTSTKIGDDIEYKAIRAVTEAPIYSCKGKIGHLVTSASVNELIYTIMFSRRGHSGFNFNLKNPLLHSHGLLTSPQYVDTPSVVTLKNSFGFGGRCMSQIIEVGVDERI